MYSSERAQNIVKKDVAYLSAGIHDDVKLVSARADKSPNGNNFIELKFDKEGMGFTHTEYEPRRSEIDTDETYQTKCDNQFSRIEQILKCFYPNPEDRTFTGETFEQFANWVVDMLEKADKSILLRIKIVYNNSGYTTLPRYAKYTFIEPMSIVNENKSVIVKLGIDLFEKPIVADQEQANPNPLMNPTVGSESVSSSLDASSDLPF